MVDCMKNRYKCIVSYDGTNFSGMQIQPNARTIQGEIEKALQKMHKNDDIQIHASGRTDSGVHAIGQVFHFDTHLQLEEKNWLRALNSLLPEDIVLKEVKRVLPTFHARFDAVEKEYRYIVLNRKRRDVFKRHYTYFYPNKLNFPLMEEACQQFIGTHDFTSFSSPRSTVKGSKVRTLYEVNCRKKDDEIHFILRGDGFLYNMVRIIVGTILEIGAGKIPLRQIPVIFRQKDRTKAGKTAPPEGLYLWKVKY